MRTKDLRPHRNHGVKAFAPGWRLRLIGISVTGTFCSPDEEIQEIVSLIEAQLDPDYTYLRTGFVIHHEGRRGVANIVGHFGFWGQSAEVFMETWYRLHEEDSPGQRLSFGDPLISLFDARLVASELERFHDAGVAGLPTIAEAYLTAH